MTRQRKARVEGDALRAIAIQGSAAELVEVTRKVADPVAGDNGAALARIVAFFKASHPAEWEALRLCPLQHGLEAMSEKLKG